MDASRFDSRHQDGMTCFPRRIEMASAATFTLDDGKLVLFGEPAGARSDNLFARRDDGAEARGDTVAAALAGVLGFDGLTITAGSGSVRVFRAFLDQPREPRRRRR
jgi:hypothetical protein